MRRDGSTTGCAMPRQGILPHDLVHYVVESTLGRSVPALPADAGRWMFDAVLALDARCQQVPWHGTLELDLPDL